MSSAAAEPAARARPMLSPLSLNLAVAAFLLAAHNRTFWGHAWALLGHRPALLALLGAAFAALMLLLVHLLAVRRLRKPALVVLILAGAASSYYLDRLGVVIDTDMIRNAMLTTPAEARHLLTPALALHLTLWGLIPAVLVLWVRVAERPLLPALWRWAAGALGLVVLILALLFPGYRAFSAIFREHRELAASFLPGAPITGLVRFLRAELEAATAGPIRRIGLDAAPGPRLAAADRPVVLVLVLGETLRAQDFGLDGYARDTTPELAARAVINFPDVTSCGTATAVSVPCMFLPETRAGFRDALRTGSENLLDVLARAGFAVEWWDNNTGSQYLGARIAERRMGPDDDPAACAVGECTDAVFLAPLADRLARIERNTVLVLHLIGSHGPAYFLRYPPDFARFTPDCRTVEFGNCTPEQIVNAYDNSVAFTDHVLGRMIDLLAVQDRLAPALWFVSDHGESLGERGLYLHGAPWFMAPPEQIRVPMLAWLPASFAATMALDPACLAERAQAPASHDNLFASLLGLLDVSTSLRDPALDLVSPCRSMP